MSWLVPHRFRQAIDVEDAHDVESVRVFALTDHQLTSAIRLPAQLLNDAINDGGAIHVARSPCAEKWITNARIASRRSEKHSVDSAILIFRDHRSLPPEPRDHLAHHLVSLADEAFEDRRSTAHDTIALKPSDKMWGNNTDQFHHFTTTTTKIKNRTATMTKIITSSLNGDITSANSVD
jgi:hypothetical protein